MVDSMPGNVGLGTFVDEDKDDHEMLDFALIYVGAHNVRLVMLKRPLRKLNPAAAFLHITSLYEPVFNSKTYILTNNHKQDNNSNPCFHAHIIPL